MNVESGLLRQTAAACLVMTVALSQWVDHSCHVCYSYYQCKAVVDERNQKTLKISETFQKYF